MSIVIDTPNGVITSYREVWKNAAGMPVYAWRTDGRDDTVDPFDPNCEPTQGPHDFGTEQQAYAFIAAVWYDAKSKAEKADRDAWKVYVVEVGP